MKTVAFNRPWVAGLEQEYLAEALASDRLSGDGEFSKRCEAILEDIGIHRAMLAPSCTHALELSALLLDIQPGDEVIVPSFTFVSTINAFVLRGAQPVFIDIRPDTLNLDERLLADNLTSKTKAIVPVHYAGVGCAMDEITEFASRHGLAVVEDNAHGLFGRYRGRFLGTFGELATQSFHETKNFSCGEGGALLINSPALVERAEILREKGTDRSRFFRGQVDKYSWVDIGSSYLPSELQAAVLCAQLEARDRIQAARRRIWEFYESHLAEWAEEHAIQMPYVPPECEQSFHMFYLLLPDLERRQSFIASLRERGIMAVFHYVPLHTSQMGERFGGREGMCPVTESVSNRLVRLPFYSGLDSEDQERVVEAILEMEMES